jgi:hypothetical protein
VVDGEEEVDAARLRLLEDGAREVELVLLHLRLADRDALCLQERVRHRAADADRVGLRDEVLEHLDLVGHLGAAQDRDERLRRVREGLPEVLDLLLDEEAGRLLFHEPRHAGRRRVRAVRRAERVIHPHVGEARQLAREGLVVRLLLRVEAEVLEEEHLPLLEVAHELLHAVADAVVGEDHVLLQELGQPRRGGLQRELLPVLRLPLRAPEVRGEHDLRLVRDGVLDGGERRADARVVRDLPLRVERHVEVDADEDALAGEVERVDRLERHGPVATTS